MTLVKWIPKRNMFNIFDEFEHLMHHAFGQEISNRNGKYSYSPFMDVSETDSEYSISIELPGVDKKDIELSVDEGVLTVVGERKISPAGSEVYNVLSEIETGTFKRSFEIGVNILEDKIKAKFINGILKISLPKAKEVRPDVKRISIS